MRAYSIDLRQRVLAALDRGMTRQQVVITFGVSLATLKRWLILQRNAAPLLPKASPGRRRVIAVEHHVALWQQLEMHPDATLASHAEQWNATHVVHQGGSHNDCRACASRSDFRVSSTPALARAAHARAD